MGGVSMTSFSWSRLWACGGHIGRLKTCRQTSDFRLRYTF